MTLTFEPSDPPRSGTFAAGATGPDGGATRHIPLRDALPLLLGDGDGSGGGGRPGGQESHVAAPTGPESGFPAHPATTFWAAATRMALRLVAAGRLLPGVSPDGFDAWRVGPLDDTDADQVRALAAAMPASARAVPLPGTDLLPAAAPLLRAFLDAVADTVVRTPAAALATGTSLYADPALHQASHLREWAAEAAAGLDAGVRMSLRVEAPDDPATGRFHAVVQVHALADPTRVADLTDIWTGAAVGFGPQARIDALLAVRRASRLWDPLARLLSQTVPDVLDLDDTDVADLLGAAAETLADGGVAVHWPRELRPELTTRVIAGRGTGPTTFGTDGEPFTLDWEVALRGDPLTAAEMDQLAESHRPVVRLRDQWVLVDPAARDRAAHRTAGPVGAVSALTAALTGEVDLDGDRVPVIATGWLADLKERLSAPAEPVGVPDGLEASLRDYQLRGLGWLARMTSLGLGACLADDMGLGKTITLIALHLHRAPEDTGPTLVVCPASLLGNWEREITRFAPKQPVVRFHGTGRVLDAEHGFVLTTYGTLLRDHTTLAAHRWGLVVADEAQHVKNPASGTARALRTVPAAARVALTGTPVENNLLELWSILDWSTPGLLGAKGEFRRRWADPIADGDRTAATRFATLIAPFLLRRRKSDPGIAPELPRKTETDRPVGLTREQAGLYEAVVAETLADIACSDGISRRGKVIALLTALKQICNHPAQYARETDPVLTGRSGKLELLDDLLDTILTEDGSVLVFTQYVAMARLLERHLAERGIPSQLLHGGTPVHTRQDLVDRFQRGEVPVFLLSLKAAGTGLNLTRADHVVHYDRWWNPAVEDQATDRAYRIGQTRPVQVHRLIAEGTLEDRIAGMLATKRALADSVLTAGEAALTELTDTELADLVELRGLDAGSDA